MAEEGIAGSAAGGSELSLTMPFRVRRLPLCCPLAVLLAPLLLCRPAGSGGLLAAAARHAVSAGLTLLWLPLDAANGAGRLCILSSLDALAPPSDLLHLRSQRAVSRILCCWRRLRRRRRRGCRLGCGAVT